MGHRLSSLSRLSLVAHLTIASVAALGTIAGCAAPTDDPNAESSSDAVTSSANASRLVDIPFYFSVPKTAVTTRGQPARLLATRRSGIPRPR